MLRCLFYLLQVPRPRLLRERIVIAWDEHDKASSIELSAVLIKYLLILQVSDLFHPGYCQSVQCELCHIFCHHYFLPVVESILWRLLAGRKVQNLRKPLNIIPHADLLV